MYALLASTAVGATMKFSFIYQGFRAVGLGRVQSFTAAVLMYRSLKRHKM
jgi:hypothetical protein